MLILRTMLSLICIGVFVSGCTYRCAYQEMQREQIRQCVEEQGIPYHECLERTNKSYDEYMREQQEVIIDN